MVEFVEGAGQSGNDQEAGVEEDVQLDFADSVEGGKTQMALPAFEDDFDAPAQSINGEDGFKAGLGWGNGGEENRPVHEREHVFGWVMASGFFFRPHTAEGGGGLVDGSSHQAHHRALLIVEHHGKVEMPPFSEQFEQAERLARGGVQIGGPCFVPVDAVCPRLKMALNFPVGEITPVAQDKIALLQLQCRGSGQVVTAVRVHGKMDKTQAHKIINGLDAGVANLGVGVSHAGEALKERGWEFEDGAVLDKDAAVRSQKARPDARNIRGALVGNGRGQKPLSDLLQARRHPIGHRLPAGHRAMPGIKGCGEVIVAGCAVNGLLTERRQQRGDGNFAGLPQGEARFAGAEINKIRTQAGGAKK